MNRKIAFAGVAGVAVLAGMAFAASGGSGSSAARWLVQLPETANGSANPASPTTMDAQAAADGEWVVGQKIAGSYICVFRPGSVGRGAETREAARSAQAANGSVRHVYSAALQGFAVNASEQGIQRMRGANPNIAWCEQDQVAGIVLPVEIAARPGGGGGGTPAPQSTPPGITRVGGGVSGATGTAWVLDTGIDLDHPDLNVDVARSRNFVSRETSPEDLNGHGTHVAGTIAAINNTIGVVGVAAGARVAAVRVLNRRGSGSYADIIAGVDYVAANGRTGDVANMSLGGGASQALDTAVINAAGRGIVFALAAGNESTDSNTKSPARANGPNVYTVSAVDRNDVFASFSNYNNPPIDYAEPGVSILSTWLNGGYNTISGTSMATPHLAGLFLLGPVRTGGSAINDPDGRADPIGVR